MFFILIILGVIDAILCQSTNSISADISLCTCDLTAGVCNINCCCDPDCVAGLLSQFSTCTLNTVITNNRVCSYQTLKYAQGSMTLNKTSQSSSSGFCIYSTTYDKYNYYSNPSIISNQTNLTLTIQQLTYSAPISTSVNSVASNVVNTSTLYPNYPSGFMFSGNIGYEFEKPIMRGVVTNATIYLSQSSFEWWPVISCDSCTSTLNTDSVKFGLNLNTGCTLRTFPNCTYVQQVAFQMLGSASSMYQYRVASFAMVNLTSQYDWISISGITADPQLSNDIYNCPILFNRKFDIYYSRAGKTDYPHNKIVYIYTTATYQSFNIANLKSLPITTTVNFFDTTSNSQYATKLSPFLNVQLPYDFFFPIYTP